MYYTYLHSWPGSDTKYVGKGSEARVKLKRRIHNKHHEHLTAKYGEPDVTCLLETDSEAKALDFEVTVIEFLKAIGVKLANATDGGEGASGYKHTEEHRAYMSEIRAGENNPMYGKKHSSEWVAAKSEFMRSDSNPAKRPEFRALMSGAANPAKRQDVREKLSGANHHNFDSTPRVFINEDRWVFIGTAYDLRITHGLLQGRVSELISGKRKSHKGWRYAGPYKGAN